MALYRISIIFKSADEKLNYKFHAFEKMRDYFCKGKRRIFSFKKWTDFEMSVDMYAIYLQQIRNFCKNYVENSSR